MPETHEDCGRGHSKPINKPCGICANLDGGLKDQVENPDAATWSPPQKDD